MITRPYNWSKIPNLEIRGKGKWCHARIEMNGRLYMRSLKIQADEMGENAPFVLDALRAFKVQLAQQNFAILQLTRTRNEHSTCQELFAAYEKACRGRDIKAETVATTQSRLAHILRQVHGEFFNVEAARTSIFTRDLAEKFEHTKIAGGTQRLADAPRGVRVLGSVAEENGFVRFAHQNSGALFFGSLSSASNRESPQSGE